jgi:hypothetical protein
MHGSIMYKLCPLIFLLLMTSVANAGTCPDFFRFVDFGQVGKDGTVYRGGSFLRAEHFDGTALLQIERTECLDVHPTNTDGHGYPIPVVTHIYYDPDKAPVSVSELRVSNLDDTNSAAAQSELTHRQRLQQDDVDITRGPDYLCATIEGAESYSCQVVSPYGGNQAPVVYCDAQQCEMPVLAVDQQIAISAKWPRDVKNREVKNSDTQTDEDSKEGDTNSAGAAIIEMAQQIHDFLSPLSSLSPR